jgi:hypothetical protein
MSINQILPFISTAIMLGFTIYVLQRFFVRRAPHFLFWGIGLAMFGAGSFAEAYLSLAWSRWIFFVWYLFGAALNAAWIGHGTLNLLIRKPWVHVVTAVLVVGSLFAGYLMLQVMPKLDDAVFTTSKPISEQYGTKVLAEGQTPPADAQTATTTYRGQTVTVVRGLPNRVIGNVLIAAGALLIGSASMLTRLGYGQFLYLAELVSAVLMFSGFRFAARPQPDEVPQAVAAAAD